MNLSLSIDRRNIFKILCYLAVSTLFYILTTARGSVALYWQVTVNAMPFLVAAIGFYEGAYVGGCMGVYCGLMMSVSSSTTEGAEAMIMGLFAIFCGSVGVRLMRRILPSVLFCGSGLLVIRAVISATYYRLFYAIPFFGVLAGYIWIIAASLPAGVAAYFIVKAISRRFSEEE